MENNPEEIEHTTETIQYECEDCDLIKFEKTYTGAKGTETKEQYDESIPTICPVCSGDIIKANG